MKAKAKGETRNEKKSHTTKEQKNAVAKYFRSKCMRTLCMCTAQIANDEFLSEISRVLWLVRPLCLFAICCFRSLACSPLPLPLSLPLPIFPSLSSSPFLLQFYHSEQLRVLHSTHRQNALLGNICFCL